MIALPTGVRVWIAAGHTDMRRGMHGAAKVRLRDVLKMRKTIIDYTYDFGDCWSIGSP